MAEVEGSVALVRGENHKAVGRHDQRLAVVSLGMVFEEVRVGQGVLGKSWKCETHY